MVYTKAVNVKIKQQGFSVVELMIATLLGIFIIGGIIGVFISSSENYRLQQALSQVQEKGRFALRRMRIDIQKAGYYIDPAEDQLAIEWSATGVVADLGANAINVLSIYRKGDGGILNTIHRTSYFMRSNVDPNNPANRNTLFSNSVTDVTVPDPNASLALVEGVARLTFRFGADLTSTSGTASNEISRSIDWIPLNGGAGFKAYLSSAELLALSDFTGDPQSAWNSVRAVQVELVMASDATNVVGTPQTISLPSIFSAASSEAVAVDLTADRYFKSYTTTYALRNRVE